MVDLLVNAKQKLHCRGHMLIYAVKSHGKVHTKNFVSNHKIQHIVKAVCVDELVVIDCNKMRKEAPYIGKCQCKHRRKSWKTDIRVLLMCSES